MNRLTLKLSQYSAFVLLLLAVGVGCNESPGVSDPLSVNSNTNWLLTCSDDVDCSEDSACFCGQCTTPCDSDAACDALGGGTCTLQGERVDFCPSEPGGLCLPGCESDDDCGESYVCVVDVCQPEWAEPDECPQGNLVCGTELGAGPATLLECVDGEYETLETCDVSCASIPGADDSCVPGCSTTLDEGVCGSEIGVDQPVLFVCGPNGQYTLLTTCPFGCEVGEPRDQCAEQP